MRLTLRGNRMGNQENIPGECVSGFIPATHTQQNMNTKLKSQHIRNLALREGDVLSVTSLYSVVSK